MLIIEGISGEGINIQRIFNVLLAIYNWGKHCNSCIEVKARKNSNISINKICISPLF